MNTSPTPIVRPVPKNKEKGGRPGLHSPPLEVVQLFCSQCLPAHPQHSGPAWSPAPLPGAAQEQGRCGNFPPDSAAGWLLLRSLSWHDTRRVGQPFLQGLDLLSPGLRSADCKGRSGFRAPGTLHPASDQGLVSGPPPPPPAASAQACFLLASCSLISFGFPSGRLPTLPKIPSRKFACCHKIMQICS